MYDPEAERCANKIMSVLSIVVPCYNEEETIPVFYQQVCEYQNRIDAELEFCFVDDGSTDQTLSVLKRLREQDERIHYASFSRNFGKEAALLAGLEISSGDYVVTMDVDLQDPPSLLPEMYEIVADPSGEYDSVATRRMDRTGEPPLRSFFARQFYRIINRLSSTEIVDGSRDYRMMTRQVADAVINDREYNRFSKGIFSWVGFRTRWIDYHNVERSAGSTKWSFSTLFKYSVEGILAYSTVPLVISSCLGILMCIGSLIALLYSILRNVFGASPFETWSSFICILIFTSGLILLSLGVIGLYISRIYLETKKRQIYIIREQA